MIVQVCVFSWQKGCACPFDWQHVISKNCSRPLVVGISPFSIERLLQLLDVERLLYATAKPVWFPVQNSYVLDWNWCPRCSLKPDEQELGVPLILICICDGGPDWKRCGKRKELWMWEFLLIRGFKPPFQGAPGTPFPVPVRNLCREPDRFSRA